MRVIFMGTPSFSVPSLLQIISLGHQIVACYTRAPKKAGRGQKEKKSPVHLAAEAANIAVFTPKSLKGATEQAEFAAHQADVAIVVAYGLLLPKPVLDAPKHGCLNLHGSLLPRWRGAAPIQRAIMAGDKTSGVMVMKMDEGLDTGPVALMEKIAISSQMNAGELHDKMMVLGADLIGRALGALERNSLRFVPQSDKGITYAKKIEKSEARINWGCPADQVHNLIRALSPFPGAWCEIEIKGKPVRVKILGSELVEASAEPGKIIGDDLTIACSSGAVRLKQVQRAGKGKMDIGEFLRGSGPLAGQILASP
ncbi:Methionyl-tRNA formyltransferase [hydrothermal vent metagenome]|uniref:methionyl-tRNA formyltransferase n=1 Tax=hydrothermal vent metagenome TaxID=652676 RepID=A0A3B0U024_9ZZZZ